MVTTDGLPVDCIDLRPLPQVIIILNTSHPLWSQDCQTLLRNYILWFFLSCCMASYEHITSLNLASAASVTLSDPLLNK